MTTNVPYEIYAIRFWNYVDVKTNENECWEWTKVRGSHGYGFFGYKGKNVLAHRFAYECVNGDDSAKEKIIRHTCDNPSCCNPKHLLAGTHQDNMNDKFERGRQGNLKGDECSWAKLTEIDVLEIRNLCDSKTVIELAEIYNVSETTISDIKYRRTWKGVHKEFIFSRTNKKDIKTYVKELLNRTSLEGVVLHYVDGNNSNRVPENVVVCPDHAYHSLLVQRTRAYEACGNADWIKCNICKQYDDPKNLYQKKSETTTTPDEGFYRFHEGCQRKAQREQRRRKALQKEI